MPGGDGIHLSSNGTATFTFDDVNITNISGFSRNGFVVSSSGTVSVLNAAGDAGTIDVTTGTAVSITSTTIGAGGLKFKSVSANGGTNGIVLTSTGSSGGLTITGDGGNTNNASGGTVQNTTGIAVLLTDTQNFSVTSDRKSVV